MDRQRRYTVTANAPIAEGVWQMQLAGSTAGFAPGRFVNVLVPPFYLRRPLAICDYDAAGFTLTYKLAGAGTRALAAAPPGAQLDILAPLGNGFTVRQNTAVLLVAGGAGVAPMPALARALRAQGCHVTVALGFNRASEAYLCDALQPLADRLMVATLDGSMGVQGPVTALLGDTGGYGCYYACGPTAMLKAVAAGLDIPGQVSLEEHMACGFGGCMGCAVPTAHGMRRVCADGPVFEREVMLWDTI